MTARRNRSPGHKPGEDGLDTVASLAHFLKVTPLYLYRVLKPMGSKEGVYHLPSQGRTQMVRIDRQKFLTRHLEPAVPSADRAAAASEVKRILGEAVPVRTLYDQWIRGMEQLYDNFSAERADKSGADTAAPSEGEQQPQAPGKTAS